MAAIKTRKMTELFNNILYPENLFESSSHLVNRSFFLNMGKLSIPDFSSTIASSKEARL